MPDNPDSLPAGFFADKQQDNPDTLPADFFTPKGPQIHTKGGGSLPADLPGKMARAGIGALPAIGGMAGALLAPEAAIPAIGAAMLGGAVGSTAKQAINYGAGEPDAPKSWGEAGKNVVQDAAVQGANEAGGRVVSGALGLVGKKLAPQRLMQSTLKPPTSMDPTARSNMLDAALKYGIPASESGSQKGDAIRRGLNANVDAAIARTPQPPIDPAAVAQRLDLLRAKWKHSPDYQTAINDAQDEFLNQFQNPIQPSEAQEVKKEFYKRATQENKAAYKQGVTPAISTQARQYLARGLKGEIEQRYPELTRLNADEGAMIDLDTVLDRFIGREGNKNVLGLVPAIVGTGAGVMAGHGPEGAAAGGLASLAVLAMDNPEIKSRLAIALSRAQKSALGRGAASVAKRKPINLPNAMRAVEQIEPGVPDSLER